MHRHKKWNDYRTLIAVGQACLIFGVLGSRIVRVVLDKVVFRTGHAFVAGFMDGITVVLLMVSILLSARGFVLYQKCKTVEMSRKTPRMKR
jgi:hypothetical protein